MNKWTWVALAAAVTVLGGSYYLLSSPKGKSGGAMEHSADSEMNVEDFDAADVGDNDGEDKGDNSYDMLDDPDAGHGSLSPGPRETGGVQPGSRTSTVDIETIDDADDSGETVHDPVVIEDHDESVEPAKPKAAP